MCIAGAGLRAFREGLYLQSEIKAMRPRVTDAASAQAENERLRQKQVSSDELARLRADHAALPRLRAELESLTAGVPAGNAAAPR